MHVSGPCWGSIPLRGIRQLRRIGAIVTIYSITSFEYLNQYLVGPLGEDLETLEEEWAASHNSGTVLEFVEWLIDNKGFKAFKPDVTYSFNRG